MAEEANGEFHDFYKYTPSLPAAITFITLFLVSTCLHIHQLLKHRAWFLIALVTGGICTFLPCLGIRYMSRGLTLSDYYQLRW